MPFPKERTTFQVYKDGETTKDIRMMIHMVLLVRGFRSKVDDELRKIDQSAARMETLSAILNMQGPKSQSDVARRLRIEGATVTRMVDVLSAEGLVERSLDPNDRRVNLLSITPAGEQAVENIFQGYDKVRNHVLKDIEPDEVEYLYGVFQRMLKRLDEPFDNDLNIAETPAGERLRDIMEPEQKRRDK